MKRLLLVGRFVLIVLVGWSALVARGSIEAIVGESEWVVRGTLRDVREDDGRFAVLRGEALILDVTEDLKGAGGVQWLILPGDGARPVAGKEVLACLSRDGVAPGQQYAVAGEPNRLIELKRPLDPLMSSSGERVREPGRLLELARLAVKQKPARPMRPGGLPPGVGGPVFASRPARTRLSESSAREKASDADPGEREFAVTSLSAFRNEENERILRGLLWDPYYTLTFSRRWETDPNRRIWRVYPVRQQAYGTLWGWNVYVAGCVDDTAPGV